MTARRIEYAAFTDIPHRAAAGGYPNADRVMEHGLVLPANHPLDDDDVDYVWETAERFLVQEGIAKL